MNEMEMFNKVIADEVTIDEFCKWFEEKMSSELAEGYDIGYNSGFADGSNEDYT